MLKELIKKSEQLKININNDSFRILNFFGKIKIIKKSKNEKFPAKFKYGFSTPAPAQKYKRDNKILNTILDLLY